MEACAEALGPAQSAVKGDEVEAFLSPAGRCLV